MSQTMIYFYTIGLPIIIGVGIGVPLGLLYQRRHKRWVTGKMTESDKRAFLRRPALQQSYWLKYWKQRNIKIEGINYDQKHSNNKIFDENYQEK